MKFQINKSADQLENGVMTWIVNACSLIPNVEKVLSTIKVNLNTPQKHLSSVILSLENEYKICILRKMKKINIYRSFEEQELQEVKNILTTDPSDRIAEVVEIIKKIYPSTHHQSKSPKRINFIKPKCNEHFH